jgi:hypothetical protein
MCKFQRFLKHWVEDLPGGTWIQPVGQAGGEGGHLAVRPGASAQASPKGGGGSHRGHQLVRPLWVGWDGVCNRSQPVFLWVGLRQPAPSNSLGSFWGPGQYEMDPTQARAWLHIFW